MEDDIISGFQNKPSRTVSSKCDAGIVRKDPPLSRSIKYFLSSVATNPPTRH